MLLAFRASFGAHEDPEVFVLVILGSSISKISGTMSELRAMNEEHSRQRREIRVYLTNQGASFELVSRIMKFVAPRISYDFIKNMKMLDGFGLEPEGL